MEFVMNVKQELMLFQMGKMNVKSVQLDQYQQQQELQLVQNVQLV